MSESKVYGVNTLDWYQGQVADLIERDRDLQKMRKRMDEMVHGDYEAPAKLRDVQWFRTYRSAKPRNALKAGVRALANFYESVSVDPLTVHNAVEAGAESIYAREMAGSWERVLSWQMRQVASRRTAFRSDVVRSALLYDEICGMLIHLPTQIAGRDRLGLDTTRQKQALQNGNWAIVNRLPSDVYFVESDYMIESACSVVVKTAKGIVDSWGEAARDLRDAIEGGMSPNELFVEFDWIDRNARAVWAHKGDDPTYRSGEVSSEFVIIPPMEVDYPVFPWSIVVGGTTLEKEEQYKREPLLMSVFLTEQWLNANITGSLLSSEAIAEFGRPKTEKLGAGADQIKTRYGVPGGEWISGPFGKIVDHPRQGLDPALRELSQMFEQSMDDSTIARALSSGEPFPGEPGFGFNLRIKTALAQLVPYKRLIERYYEGHYRNMLLQSHYSGEDIRAYGVGKEDRGTEYIIQAEWIDPEKIYLEVTQEADIPIERQAQINGAVMISRELPVSPETILDELGVADPARELKFHRKWQFQQAYMAGKIQKIQVDASEELKRIIQEGVAAAMQGMQQPQGPQAGPPPGVEPAQMMQPGMGVPGGEALAGIGNNPAMGGGPAAMMNPAGATFEGATGTTRGGEEMAGV